MRFPSKAAFLARSEHAITLLGMSGVGKTTVANRLPKESWFHYSGDYRIGTRYLAEPILDNIKRHAMQDPFLRDLLKSDSIYICHNITVDNLDPLSTFLGKLSRDGSDGLPLGEFLRRQALYRDAEIRAMLDVPHFMDRAREIYGYRHFVNDAGGSLCEIVDIDNLAADPVIQALAERTVIVYLEADESLTEALCRRAEESPKPLCYRREFLEEQIRAFEAERAAAGLPAGWQADDFVRWVFRRLVAARRPRYEAIARACGYTVPAGAVAEASTAEDFLGLIGDAIERVAERADATSERP